MELNFEEIGNRTGRSAEDVARFIDQAKDSMIPKGRQIAVAENGATRWFIVTRRGVGLIRTDYGDFYQFDFSIDDSWVKYSVIVNAEINGDMMPVFKKSNLLLIRVDSGCETGQMFGDRTCECREQLALALETIGDAGEGMVVNIPRQDGRGLGLPFKLATLRLQTLLKINTVEAAHAVAPDGIIDMRTYGGVIGILKFFGIPPTMKINLATNNVNKARVFDENGYSVEGYTPVVIPPTEYTSPHLYAKQEHLGHIGLIPSAEKRPPRRALALLRDAMVSKNTLACVGLDPDLAKMPLSIIGPHASDEVKVSRFLREVIDITGPHICAYKVQKAFFDVFPKGHELLVKVVAYVQEHYPEVMVFVDAKVGDIDNTMDAYLRNIFEEIRADGLVVNPYMGDDVLKPFESLGDKAGVVLVKTSNPGADIVQNIVLSDGRMLWQYMLQLVAERWNRGSNLIPVLSSIADADLSGVRQVIPDDMPILFAGYGVQGGSLDHFRQLLDSTGRGVFVNSSRGVLYPYDPAETEWRQKILDAVIELKETLNQWRSADAD
ncbi:MAG TPA: orotidine-5'-phosphate decarboxylase [Candidatus Paceibacterota bacterium]|nr:orotidine-5'-phosphate decarboxylase [Candidatus Paceibacterota bacterium]